MGVALVGCDEASKKDSSGDSSGQQDELLTGTEKITVGEYKVNVSCAGEVVKGRPTVMLLHGGGDDLTKLADLQKTLSADGRVCSYDRLGAGKSDQPKGEQDYESVGDTLTGVIDEVGGGKVVLAGHSMGGLIAGRFASEHQDKVAGLVLLDATSPSAIADLERRIPADATGDAGELRAQTLAIYGGENPEKLVFADGEVASAGEIPVRVVRHGQPYFEQVVPEYGPGLEEDWTKGQKAWLGLSEDSELSVAKNSGHYIYTDEPEVAVRAVEDVIA